MPLVAQGKNVMFQSETGTGKTFAFLLPLVQAMSEEPASKDVRLLIATPTYELASQIKVQVQLVTDLPVALCIGGAPLSRQLELLKARPAIVVGGPARLLELIHLKKLKVASVRTLVLDEADRLLSPELRGETIGLLERLPSAVQLVGCSATVSDFTRSTLQMARTQSAPEEKPARTDGRGAVSSGARGIELVTMPPEDVLKKRIEHWAVFAERRDKIDTLRSFVAAVKPKKLLVFTARNDQLQNITSKLRYHNVECMALGSKTDKKERKTAIDRFRSGKLRVLVTTDLASRGLDIADITHVVQLDFPDSADFFIHRAGRTARAGKTGVNCVIGDAWELQRYAALEKRLGITVHPKALSHGQLVKPEA